MTSGGAIWYGGRSSSLVRIIPPPSNPQRLYLHGAGVLAYQTSILITAGRVLMVDVGSISALGCNNCQCADQGASPVVLSVTKSASQISVSRTLHRILRSIDLNSKWINRLVLLRWLFLVASLSLMPISEKILETSSFYSSASHGNEHAPHYQPSSLSSFPSSCPPSPATTTPILHQTHPL